MHSSLLRRSIYGLLAAAPALLPQTIPSETEFRAKLLGPLNTQTSRKGDAVTAQVISPQAFQGGILEGKVQESKSGGKVKGTSVLNFSFDKLNHNGKVIPVQSSIKGVVNSKGVQNADEEGRVVKKKNNLGKMAIATGLGAAIGAAVGGGKGAAIGAGAGAAAGLIFIEVGVEGANVSFAPGSEFILAVKEQQAR
jgi:hypothetical protein